MDSVRLLKIVEENSHREPSNSQRQRRNGQVQVRSAPSTTSSSAERTPSIPSSQAKMPLHKGAVRESLMRTPAHESRRALRIFSQCFQSLADRLKGCVEAQRRIRSCVTRPRRLVASQLTRVVQGVQCARVSASAGSPVDRAQLHPHCQRVTVATFYRLPDRGK